MSEENKALIRLWAEEFDKKNLAVVDDTVTRSATFYYPGDGSWNCEAQLDSFNAFFLAVPDYHHTMGEQIAEGDKE